MQEEFDAFYCVVDLHAITAGAHDPKELIKSTRSSAAIYLAAGLDPGALQRLCPVARVRALRAVLAAQLRDANRLAREDDPVQGEGAQGGEDVSGSCRTIRCSWRAISCSTTRTSCPWARISGSTWSSLATSPGASTTCTEEGSGRRWARRDPGRPRAGSGAGTSCASPTLTSPRLARGSCP